jgi:hypothetical protein
MITITDTVKRRFRLERIVADVKRDGWTGKNIEFTIRSDNNTYNASINDTTRGGPNRMAAYYLILGTRAEVSVNVFAETNSDDGIKDIKATIRDAQNKEIDISNVRFVVTTELQECMLLVEEKPASVLDGLVGGPMGSSAHMFIIDEEHNVFVGTENDTRDDYVNIGKLVANMGEREAEANYLEIIGSFPDSAGDHYYISLGWSKEFLSTISNNEKQQWFSELDALVAMLLEKIKAPA